jgi:xanthine dehydrogenase accessory factor
MRNIYLHIDRKKLEDSTLAIATVISTTGSTPQKPGNSALFNAGGLILGTVGGGILEAKVRDIAVRSVLSGISSLCTFDLNRDITFKSEAICGGRVTVLIDADISRHYEVFLEASQLTGNRISCVMATTCREEGINQVIVKRDIYSLSTLPSGDRSGAVKIADEVRRLISQENPGAFSLIETEDDSGARELIFLEPLFPPDRLIIAGAGHIGKALCHYGKRLGFDVTVIDDRPEFACTENLPEADHILLDDIGATVRNIKKDKDTFIVIVTRGHNDDAEALKQCIASGASYIGMIGSRTKIAKMKEEFISKQMASEEQWNAIHAPVGIDILSQTVEEIALSIASEIVLVRNSIRRVKKG